MIYLLACATFITLMVSVIPGGGTFGMESIARQFGDEEHVLVIRNGWFSFRWSEIFEKAKIAKSVSVLAASQQAAAEHEGANRYAPFAPMAVEKVCFVFQKVFVQYCQITWLIL